MLARKKILLAKKETTYGVDVTPTGAANAMMTKNLSVKPLDADTVQRDIDRPTLGKDLDIHVGARVMVEFEIEASASGALGTAPAYGELFLGCGFAETVTASTKVEYDPVSSSFDSLTLYFHHDGNKHAVTGARGNVSMSFNAKEIPMFKFTFTGIWNAPSATADPTPVWTSFTDPLPVTNTNTPTFTIHGVSPNMSALSLDMGNEIVHRDVVGSESVMLVDRAVSGSVAIESVAISTKDWFSVAKANTTAAMQLVHGTAAGSIVQIDTPDIQVLTPDYGDEDGVSMTNMGLSAIPGSSGDDEIKLTFI